MGSPGITFEDALPPLLPRLRRVAGQMLANRALAEEAVQEALLRAYRFWDTRRTAQLWPWLRTLVIRECLRASARDATARRASPIGGTVDTPDDIAVRREEHAEVRHALAALPDGYRRVLVLHHGRGVTEADIAAVLGLPLGTVKWRVKRAHDHLRRVLTRQETRPLAETLREVAREMPLEIEVTVGSLPFKDPPDWPDPAPEEAAPALVSLREAQAEVPAFQLPLSMGREGRCARVMRKDDGSPRGVQYDVDGGFTDRDGGWSVTYGMGPRPRELHFHIPDGQRVVFNEPTPVGVHPGRWYKVDEDHFVAWHAAGGLWEVVGKLPAAEIRGIAEEIAAMQPPEPDAGEEPEEPPEPCAPPAQLRAAEARRLLPGFTLSDAFLERHHARILSLHRSRKPAPDGMQAVCDGFMVTYIPAGSQPIILRGFEMLADQSTVGGRAAIWWRAVRRPARAVSWPAADGGRWRVGGELEPKALRRIAAEVAAAAGALREGGMAPE